jgi:Xaa-Pro aminopeptidase
VDSGRVNYRLMHCIPESVEKVEAASPIEWMKAVKTPAEMEHIRAAHVKDGVAVTKFIWWLKKEAAQGGITEMEAAEKLEEFRGQMDGYLGPSFDPIIAYGEHGAIVHYEATPDTDVELQPKGLCLADTGGHYMEGTTDITRTIALGEITQEERKAYTMVLKGHLNLAAARFPYGVCGQNLDVLARGPLWENGLDFNHGTGHGVGYLLSVHEGPQNFRWRMKNAAYVPLEEGMVISNEPGLYLTGKFGIRHENLMLCRKGEKNDFGQFMYLEPLTMVPFDRDAIDQQLLTEREITLLNAYHKKVYETLAPYLEGEVLQWLRMATAEIKKSRN